MTVALETSIQSGSTTRDMKLTKKSFLWGLLGAAALALAVYIAANGFSWNNLSAILPDDGDGGGAGWMIVVGLILFGVRALISKPDKAKS